jgi:hypothetical protein
MTQNIIIQAFKSFVIDLLKEVLYFPIWWYTAGLKRTVLYIWNSIRSSFNNLALPIMFKNLFKPMFGQYDREGRIISFFMRIILTISRLVVFILFIIFYILLLIIWVVIPIIIVWGIVNNFQLIWK